jgi:tRNA-(ms[2]io[6]A)-hydroxylase
VSEAKKRHLPIVKAPVADGPKEDDEPRPGWHWVGFGAVLVFACWVPLAVLAEKVAQGLAVRTLGDVSSREEVAARVAELHGGARAQVVAALVLPHALALALASLAGGWVMGRYGGVGAREGALAGVAVGVVSVVLAWASSGGSWALGVVLVLAAAFAALGSAAGRRAARRGVRP